jgi:inhibitor of cysteine peptidase
MEEKSMIRRLPAITSLCLLLLLLLSACNGTERVPTDPSQPIEVEEGDEFTIVIDSNPTTGYEWRLVEDTPNGAVAEFVNQEYDPDEPGATGSGGVDIWTFRGVAAGETEIMLGYFPPDGSDVPQTVTTYHVTVR